MMAAISFTDYVGFGDSISLNEIIEDEDNILSQVHKALTDADINVSLTEACIFWSWLSVDYDACWLIPGTDESIVRHFREFVEQFSKE
jgi:hypothetical protein